jgi:beta-galactosidase
MKRMIKKITITVIFPFISIAGFAQIFSDGSENFSTSPLSFDREEYENPLINSVNREPYATTSISFATEKEALQVTRSSSSRYKSLNGQWRFKLLEDRSLFSPDLMATNCDDRSWDTIPVPSTWELLGYGDKVYCGGNYDFRPVNPPFVPRKENHTGLYRTRFEVPDAWNDNVLIHFEGVRGAFYLYINGNKVGYNEDGGTLPAVFDITPYLVKGENQLSLQVLRWSDGSYLEDQDHWRFHGVCRNVYLETRPDVFIRDFAVFTELNEHYTDARLRIRPTVSSNKTIDVEGWTLEAKLYSTDGQPVHGIAMTIPVSTLTREN